MRAAVAVMVLASVACGGGSDGKLINAGDTRPPDFVPSRVEAGAVDTPPGPLTEGGGEVPRGPDAGAEDRSATVDSAAPARDASPGDADAAGPWLAVSPTTADYGRVPVGTTKSLKFTITSYALQGVVTARALTGQPPPNNESLEFRPLQNGDMGVMCQHSPCEIEVRFTPMSEGPRQVTLEVRGSYYDGGVGQPVRATAALTGIGTTR